MNSEQTALQNCSHGSAIHVLEEEIRCEVLVLVARKVRLGRSLLRKAQLDKALDSLLPICFFLTFILTCG